MSDFRADAVKAIRKCKFESDMPSDWYRGMECAQNIVEELQSAEAVPLCDDCTRCTVKALNRPSADAEWIPVSERLPKESGDYLCTIPLDEVDTYVDVLSFHKSKFYEDDDEWGATYYDDVLAWMNLPKPYKGGGNE